MQRLATESGAVDILVANAGLPANGELAHLSVEDIARAVDINVRSTLVLTRLLLPRMLEQASGDVPLIGSLAGLAPTPRSSVYNASNSPSAASATRCARSCAARASVCPW